MGELEISIITDELQMKILVYYWVKKQVSEVSDLLSGFLLISPI